MGIACENFALLVPPLHWKRLHQPRQRHALRLPPVQDRLDNGGGQQREAEQAA